MRAYEFILLESESDDEIMNRIREKFSLLERMTQAIIDGKVKALIISGPPGVGKSYGVEVQMEKASLFDRLAERKVRYEVVKGAMTAIGLYYTLYKMSDPKNVLVFDDCDSIFMDDISLNILKAAFDRSNYNRVSWPGDLELLRRENIPPEFQFKGAIIFITNLNFGNIKSKKLQSNLRALQSHAHFLDMSIDTERDKMLRIRQVHRDTPGGLFRDYEFTQGEDKMILDFMQQNLENLREVSLRMALKIAELVKVSPDNWQTYARSICMKNSH